MGKSRKRCRDEKETEAAEALLAMSEISEYEAGYEAGYEAKRKALEEKVRLEDEIKRLSDEISDQKNKIEQFEDKDAFQQSCIKILSMKIGEKLSLPTVNQLIDAAKTFVKKDKEKYRQLEELQDQYLSRVIDGKLLADKVRSVVGFNVLDRAVTSFIPKGSDGSSGQPRDNSTDINAHKAIDVGRKKELLKDLKKIVSTNRWTNAVNVVKANKGGSRDCRKLSLIDVLDALKADLTRQEATSDEKKLWEAAKQRVTKFKHSN
jgi:hypothetical protein